MKLVEDRYGLRIEGDGNQRARIAFASENKGRIAYTVETPACVR